MCCNQVTHFEKGGLVVVYQTYHEGDSLDDVVFLWLLCVFFTLAFYTKVFCFGVPLRRRLSYVGFILIICMEGLVGREYISLILRKEKKSGD
jgi:hypothetical protein